MGFVDGAEVAKHNTTEDCWVVINGKVWDVSGRCCLFCHFSEEETDDN